MRLDARSDGVGRRQMFHEASPEEEKRKEMSGARKFFLIPSDAHRSISVELAEAMPPHVHLDRSALASRARRWLQSDLRAISKRSVSSARVRGDLHRAVGSSIDRRGVASRCNAAIVAHIDCSRDPQRRRAGRRDCRFAIRCNARGCVHARNPGWHGLFPPSGTAIAHRNDVCRARRERKDQSPRDAGA
jgi:hypothetical protein